MTGAGVPGVKEVKSQLVKSAAVQSAPDIVRPPRCAPANCARCRVAPFRLQPLSDAASLKSHPDRLFLPLRSTLARFIPAKLIPAALLPTCRKSRMLLRSRPVAVKRAAWPRLEADATSGLQLPAFVSGLGLIATKLPKVAERRAK